MQGHIRKRTTKGGEIRYDVIYDVPPGPGRDRQQRTKTFKSKKEAERALTDAIKAVNDGVYTDSTITVDAYLKDWIAGKATLKSNTTRSYSMHIQLYLSPHLGRLLLRDLRPAHVEAMYRSIKATRGDAVGPTTMRRIHATLSSALNSAVRRRYIPVNPAAYVELAPAPRPKIEAWTMQDLVSFVESSKDDRLVALYLLMGLRGLRRGEAVGLKWSDVDLDAASLRVERQIVQVGWLTEVGTPKTKSGVRTVALDQTSVRALRQHRVAQHRERLQWGESWIDEDFVFTKEDGSHLHPDYVTRHFPRLVRTAGLPKITVHGLRHTAASIALAAGVPMTVVQQQLGHSSMVITADTYSHVSPALSRSSADRVGDLFEEVVAGAR